MVHERTHDLMASILISQFLTSLERTVRDESNCFTPQGCKHNLVHADETRLLDICDGYDRV